MSEEQLRDEFKRLRDLIWRGEVFLVSGECVDGDFGDLE